MDVDTCIAEAGEKTPQVLGQEPHHSGDAREKVPTSGRYGYQSPFPQAEGEVGVGVEAVKSWSLPFLRAGTYRTLETSEPQKTYCWGWWSGSGRCNLQR